MTTIPLTVRGAEKLKEELARLKGVERHAVIQAIAEARAQGDLSENAEYEAAKDKQGFIEGRILEIESKLAAAQIHERSWDQAAATLRTLRSQSWPQRFGDVQQQARELERKVEDREKK